MPTSDVIQLAGCPPAGHRRGPLPECLGLPVPSLDRGRRRLGLPVEAPDPVNRCAALHDPVPQSLRQQELVCLTSGHVNCPRYLRGSHVADRAARTRSPGRASSRPAIAGSVAILVVAFLLSVAFVVANGGLTLTRGRRGRRRPARPGRGRDGRADRDAAGPTATRRRPRRPADRRRDARADRDAEPRRRSPSADPDPGRRPPTPTPPTPTPKGDHPAGRDGEPDEAADPVPGQGELLHLLGSGRATTCTASPTTSASPSATVKAWNPWTDNGLQVGRDLRIPPPTR